MLISYVTRGQVYCYKSDPNNANCYRGNPINPKTLCLSWNLKHKASYPTVALAITRPNVVKSINIIDVYK